MTERVSKLRRKRAEDLLRQLGQTPDGDVSIAEAALAFALLDRPSLDLEPYRKHLDLISEDVGKSASAFASDGDQLEELGAVLSGVHGYVGDARTYDDLDNADLMRVIDRRRGLPVALGIIYLHAARAQGWHANGLAFPAHFLIEVEAAGQRAVIDPFGGGVTCDARRLKSLLQRVMPKAEMSTAYLEPVTDRDILLRLQNNIKGRLFAGDKTEPAAAVIERMLLIAPENAPLWRELGTVRAKLGQLVAAGEAFETAMRHTDDKAEIELITKLRAQLKGRLN